MATVRHLGLGIPRLKFQILKIWDLIYPNAKKEKKIATEMSYLTIVLNSNNLLELVNFSGHRHLGFLVQTINNTRNGFYVSQRYFQRYHTFPCHFWLPRYALVPKSNMAAVSHLGLDIRQILFHILKLGDLPYPHAKKNEIPIEMNNFRTVLNSTCQSW